MVFLFISLLFVVIMYLKIMDYYVIRRSINEKKLLFIVNYSNIITIFSLQYSIFTFILFEL